MAVYRPAAGRAQSVYDEIMEGCESPKAKRRNAGPGADAVPVNMCPRCGLRCGRNGPHEDYRACIGALRDLVARLQFARRGAHEDSMLRA